MTFLPVKGYEGLYEVSDQGQVRSIDRIVLGQDGVQYPFKGRILRPHPNKNVEYLQLSLWKNGVGTSHYVHILVAEAHIPNPTGLPEVNHDDGIRHHNFKSNLEWVTSSGNKFHAVQTGLRVYSSRMSEEEWYECLCSVINGESYYNLSLRTPYKVPNLSIRVRKLAKKLGLEIELDQSLSEQKAERARINGRQYKGKTYINSGSNLIRT
mgnify:CR=1 FL=1